MSSAAPIRRSPDSHRSVGDRAALRRAANIGQATRLSKAARAKQAEKRRRHAAAVKAWSRSDQPDWLTEEVYREKIQPRLVGVTVSAISSALGISEPYAAVIRSGRYQPHPRHWQTLARLVRATQDA